jgi:hypothetical protein
MLILTESEALKAIVLFLQQHYEKTKPDDTGFLVMALLTPKTANRDCISIRDEWLETLKEVRNKSKRSIDTTYACTLTEEEAFDAMYLFLEKYYARTKSDDIGSLLGDLMHGIYGATADPAAWYIWQECLEKVKHLKDNFTKFG